MSVSLYSIGQKGIDLFIAACSTSSLISRNPLKNYAAIQVYAWDIDYVGQGVPLNCEFSDAKHRRS